MRPFAWLALPLFLVGCTHGDGVADTVLRIPALPPQSRLVEAAPDGPTAWVEPVTREVHATADVKMSYFAVHVPSVRASETISSYLDEWAKASTDAIEREAMDAASEEDDPSRDVPRFSLEVKCASGTVRVDLVSLLCEVSRYAGGVHGTYVAEAFNFAIDGDEARPIGIDDLFLDASAGRLAVGDACLSALRHQDAMWVKEGSVTDVRDMLDTFHFDAASHALVVHFAPYEVGPFAEGEHVVAIPYGEVAGLRPFWARVLRA